MFASHRSQVRHRQVARPILTALLLAPMLVVLALPDPTLEASAVTTCEIDVRRPSEEIKCCSCGYHPDDTFFCRSGAKSGFVYCDSSLGREVCEEKIHCEWMGVE